MTILYPSLTINDFTTAIYCFVDHYFKIAGEEVAAKSKLSDAEVITTSLVAARYFSDNMTKARSYMQQYHCCQMPHKSNFNRMLHWPSGTIAWAIASRSSTPAAST